MRGVSGDPKRVAKGAGAADSCEGKKRFSNWNGADFAAKNLRRHREIKVAPYPCRRCCGFHVGEKLK